MKSDEQALRLDQAYSRYARLYDLAVKYLPLWRSWISTALDYLIGPKILEISFGPGYLLSRYPQHYQVVGLEINRQMIATARRNLLSADRSILLLQGDVFRLPFGDCSFNTLVNTMAFSGYPDGESALVEMTRVLVPGGRLVMIDIGPPVEGHKPGSWLLAMWQALGDRVYDMPALFASCGLVSTGQRLGGFGTIHQYLAMKPDW